MNYQLKQIFIVLLLVVTGISSSFVRERFVSGNTYYISSSGRDANPCSFLSPCRTYQRAESLAVAGDVISFAKSIYPSFIITKPVTVIGNESLINSSTPNGITISSDGVTLRGFEVVNSTSFGIYVDKRNFVIENNVVHNTVTSNNATSTTCKNPDSGWGSAIKVRVGGGNGIIRNNTAYKNCGEGIAVTRGFNVIVESNTIYDNYSVNIYIDNSYDVIVRNNVSYCTGIYKRNGNRANAYALGEEEYSGWGTKLDSILIDHNVGKDCRRGIIALESYRSSSVYSNITISNNDFSTGQTRSISLDNTHNLNVLVQNNIIFGSIWVRSPSGVTLRNNVLLGTPTWTAVSGSTPTFTPTFTNTVTRTPTVPPIKNTSTVTATVTPTFTITSTPVRTVTPIITRTPTNTAQSNSAPYPSAPLCPSHDPTIWHNLWDSTRGCHYDHEHGQSPFTSDVEQTFPGFDLQALQCGKEIGHCNPSSPLENEEAHHNGKHGGMKWQVDTSAPQGCIVGFEGGEIAVDAYAVMHHNLGRQDVEFESRTHSGVFMLRQCKASNSSDKGYMFVGQLIEYGQRVMPYQGFLLPYPDNFSPVYDTPRGPYFTTECFGDGSSLGIVCRPTFNFSGNNLSIWTSITTPPNAANNGIRPLTSPLAGLLFRVRDAYQRLDVRDMVHPFTWRFVCSSDGGITYNPVGCRFNNSSTTVQQFYGRIPSSWDNLVGFDTDLRLGRITAQGFVTRFGDLNPTCTVAGGLDCQPIKMVNAFVGLYSSELSAEKVSNPTPLDTPEHDIYFCNGIPCKETDFGAVPSGWIGSEN